MRLKISNFLDYKKRKIVNQKKNSLKNEKSLKSSTNSHPRKKQEKKKKVRTEFQKKVNYFFEKNPLITQSEQKRVKRSQTQLEKIQLKGKKIFGSDRHGSLGDLGYQARKRALMGRRKSLKSNRSHRNSSNPKSQKIPKNHIYLTPTTPKTGKSHFSNSPNSPNKTIHSILKNKKSRNFTQEYSAASQQSVKNTISNSRPKVPILIIDSQKISQNLNPFHSNEISDLVEFSFRQSPKKGQISDITRTWTPCLVANTKTKEERLNLSIDFSRKYESDRSSKKEKVVRFNKDVEVLSKKKELEKLKKFGIQRKSEKKSGKLQKSPRSRLKQFIEKSQKKGFKLKSKLEPIVEHKQNKKVVKMFTMKNLMEQNVEQFKLNKSSGELKAQERDLKGSSKKEQKSSKSRKPAKKKHIFGKKRSHQLYTHKKKRSRGGASSRSRSKLSRKKREYIGLKNVFEDRDRKKQFELSGNEYGKLPSKRVRKSEKKKGAGQSLLKMLFKQVGKEEGKNGRKKEKGESEITGESGSQEIQLKK